MLILSLESKLWWIMECDGLTHIQKKKKQILSWSNIQEKKAYGNLPLPSPLSFTLHAFKLLYILKIVPNYKVSKKNSMLGRSAFVEKKTTH